MPEKLSERIDHERDAVLRVRALGVGAVYHYTPAFGDLKRLAAALEAENERLRIALAEDDSSLHRRVREAESAAKDLRWLLGALAAQSGGQLRINLREVSHLTSKATLSMWNDLQTDETVIQITESSPRPIARAGE